jgi:hypothetical protein
MNADSAPTTDKPKLRWFQPTPGRLLVVLLAVEGLLWLSERLGSPEWHKGYAVLVAIACVGVALLVMFLWFIAALCFRWRFQFSLRSLLVLTVAVAVPCSWLAAEMRNERREKAAADALHADRVGRAGGRVWVELTWLGELLQDDSLVRVVAVDFSGESTTDARLVRIQEFSQLETLWLEKSRVSDAGLGHLQELSQLQYLYLSGTKITDAGLVHLQKLRHLEELGIEGTNVTNEGVKKFRQALPKCKIER